LEDLRRSNQSLKDFLEPLMSSSPPSGDKRDSNNWIQS